MEYSYKSCIKKIKIRESYQRIYIRSKYFNVSFLKLKIQIELYSHLQHPNIVQYFGIYNFNGDKFIVMEMMASGNLRNLMNDIRDSVSIVELIFMYEFLFIFF